MHRNVGTLFVVIGFLFGFVYPLPLIIIQNGVTIIQVGITTLLGLVLAIVGIGIYTSKIKIKGL